MEASRNLTNKIKNIFTCFLIYLFILISWNWPRESPGNHYSGPWATHRPNSSLLRGGVQLLNDQRLLASAGLAQSQRVAHLRPKTTRVCIFLHLKHPSYQSAGKGPQNVHDYASRVRDSKFQPCSFKGKNHSASYN